MKHYIITEKQLDGLKKVVEELYELPHTAAEKENEQIEAEGGKPIEALCDIFACAISELHRELKFLVEDIEMQEERTCELTSIREKCRWRKQSEEPAPEDTMVLIQYLDVDGYQIALAPMEDFYDEDGEPCYSDIKWRPLDLPEEAPLSRETGTTTQQL
ncbi:MAG: hypothetical protein Q4D58_12285 [Synergistaceae bacterium]|nr:hypothetical protein [Synergistaceae bacterium]